MKAPSSAAACVLALDLGTTTGWAMHTDGAITSGTAYAGVPVGTIKLHATGKGNADKAAMIAAMRLAGHNPADDNEADALAIVRWALESGAPLQMPSSSRAK